MLSYLKYNCVGLMTFLLVISCNKSKRFTSYSVSEVLQKDTREVERMGHFYITGIVDGRVNLGFIMAFNLCDTASINECMYIVSDYSLLPSNRKVNIRIKLYKETAFNEAEFPIFEEENELC